MASDYGITIGKCAAGYAIKADGNWILDKHKWISWTRPTLAEAEELAERFRLTVQDRQFGANYARADLYQFCSESEFKARQAADPTA